MKNKKEAIFYFQGDARILWLENNPNKHRKGHLNYSSETFIVIAYLMQRFSLTQKGALQVLAMLLQELGVDIPVPSQTSTSREFDKYHRLLHGWKHIFIKNNCTDKTERVCISYKKPAIEYNKNITLSAEQNTGSSIFKTNNQEIKVKKVVTVKTPIPHNKVIAKKINTLAKSNYSKEVTKWLYQNKRMATLVHKLLQINGSELFDALIPLMPKVKDKNRKLTRDYLHSLLEKHPKKVKDIKATLSKDSSIYKLAYATPELTVQPFIIKYCSMSNNVTYNVAIWIYCPISRLSFIRLNNTDFYRQLNKNENLNTAKISITAVKKQKELTFHSSFFDGQSTHHWDTFLPLSTPPKKQPAEMKANMPGVWGFREQHVCLGENIPNNETIKVTDKLSVNKLIIDFAIGNKSNFSPDSLIKHLRSWLSHLNENSEASPADNKTYHNNKHVIRVSELL